MTGGGRLIEPALIPEAGSHLEARPPQLLKPGFYLFTLSLKGVPGIFSHVL